MTQARKSTPGAVRALELDGEHAGRIGYVVVDDRRTTTQQSTAVPATAVRPQGPIPLAVRENRLKNHRCAIAVALLRPQLDSSATVPQRDMLVRLAIVFGTIQTHASPLIAYDLMLDDLPGAETLGATDRELHDKLWPLTSALPDERLDEALWARLKPVLMKRTTPVEHLADDSQRAWTEATTLARLLDVDPDPCWIEAVATRPEPAAWAKERRLLAHAAVAGLEVPGAGSELTEDAGDEGDDDQHLSAA